MKRVKIQKIESWLTIHNIQEADPKRYTTSGILQYPYSSNHRDMAKLVIMQGMYGKMYDYQWQMDLVNRYEKEIDFVLNKVCNHLSYITLKGWTDLLNTEYRKNYVKNGIMEEEYKKLINSITVCIYAKILASMMYKHRYHADFAFMIKVFAEIFQSILHITTCYEFANKKGRNLPF